MLERQCRYKTI